MFKEIYIGVMAWYEGDIIEYKFNKGETRLDFIRGDKVLRSREVFNSVEVLSADGSGTGEFEKTTTGEFKMVHVGEFEQTPIRIDLWQEALDAGAIMLSDLDKNKIQKEIDRGILKSTLNEKLLDLEYKFPDGRVIQTRPSDQVFISGAISLGGAEWILKDNTTAYVTSSELQVAMKSAAEEISELYLEYSKTLDPKMQ